MSDVGRRPKIPFDVEARVLYNAGWRCCVCRQRRVQHIHHIDGNPQNNAESNLVGICNLCHDEAHSKHELSKNLTPKRLRDAKARWEKRVKQMAVEAVTAAGQSRAIWTYINHGRLHDFMAKTGCKFDKSLLNELRAEGLVDKFGMPQRVKHPSEGHPLWTMYDWLPFPASHRVHALAAHVVDCIASRTNPMMLDAAWQRRLIRTLAKPGTVCFCLRGFYFKTVAHDNEDRVEERIAYSKARHIQLRLRISTREMFGSSAVHNSFTGHRSAAALFVVKSVDYEGSDLVISGTPIALGMNFRALEESPYSGPNIPTATRY